MATKSKPRRKAKTEKVDVYQLVTDQIVQALEAGYVPWHKPWRATEAPTSMSTKKPYQGVNVFLLSTAAHAHGYTSRWWGTFNQIKEQGGHVRAGERGTMVVFWRFIEDKDATGKVTKRIPFLRYFVVFNADQADDLDLADDGPVEAHEPIGVCDEIVARYQTAGGPAVKTGGDSAYYHPILDYVQMPPLASFASAERYYGVAFHELGHSTGHESRLNRKGIGSSRFGDPDYSQEELVAEMTAAFVCGEAGIPVAVQDHAGYIGHWVDRLKGDTKLVIQAASAAQKASDLILGRTPPVKEEQS